MKNKLFRLSRKVLALVLVVVSLFGIFASTGPITAEAAGSTVMNFASTVKIDTSGSSFYMAKKNAKIRNGTKALSATYATLKSGAILQVSGTTGDYYKVSMDGSIRYIKKSELVRAESHRNASLIYTKNSCALRKAPDQDASGTTLNAYTALPALGTVEHKGNTWYIVWYNNSIRYIYGGNVRKVNKITLSVSGNTNSMMVGDTTKLTYSVDPKVNVTWSSSNTKIATVNMAGIVTAKGAGSCYIKATINGVMSVSYKISVVSYETQIKNTYSTIKKMAKRATFDGYCGLYAGCTVKALGITTELNAANGNGQYDVYKKLVNTSGGYKVKAYSATKYSLKSALNAVSNKNAKNILVGFHKGSGEAGAKYGHVVFIHAIVNGKVYFSESFGAKVAGKYYTEGTPIVCTIDQFAAYYNSWCVFEGIIHFDK